MGEHEKENTVSWYSRISGREVAIVRGLVTAVVSVALIWGVDLTDLGEQVNQTADVLGTLLTFLSPFWIRTGVSPAAAVLVKEQPGGGFVAGGASSLPAGTPVSVTVDPLA